MSKMEGPPWLVWVYPVNISIAFNMAPRLEITKEMRNLGWKVDLIVCGPNGRNKVEGVEVLCFRRPDFYFIRHLFFHLQVISYILENWKRIDVVLFTQPSALWLFPLRLLSPLGRQRPLFVMDTRTVPMELIEKATFKERLLDRFYYFMNNLANKLADGQTSITQRMADYLNIPTNKLWGTWPSGVNLDQFSLAAQNRHWPAANDSVQLIYIGWLGHERNVMTFCHAVMAANQRGMNFSFRVFGDGSERQELQAFASQTHGMIKVFEPIPHEQIPAILARVHVGVLPFPDEDKYRVSSPIKLFEYMGSGLPILATKIACHTDVIGGDDYVFWAENSNSDGLLKALEKIWRERFTLSDLGQKSLTAAQKWTYRASTKRLHNALQNGLSLHWAGMKKIHCPPTSSEE